MRFFYLKRVRDVEIFFAAVAGVQVDRSQAMVNGSPKAQILGGNARSLRNAPKPSRNATHSVAGVESRSTLMMRSRVVAARLPTTRALGRPID